MISHGDGEICKGKSYNLHCSTSIVGRLKIRRFGMA